MTITQLFNNLASGKGNNDKVLFYPILMHFAARFNNTSYGRFASDYKTLVESNIWCMEHFDLDMVSLISDPYRETSAFGAEIEFIPEGVPKCKINLVSNLDDVKLLNIPDVYNGNRTRDRINGAVYYHQVLKGDVPVIGWIEGPLTEACDLAGVSEMLLFLMMEIDLANNLMDKCMIVAKAFAKAQIEAGCQIIGIGDAICSQKDIETYNTFVLQRHIEVIEFIHAQGAKVKLHICGDINHLLPSLVLLKPDILDIDWQIYPENARLAMGNEVILSGNINPVLIQGKNNEEISALAMDLISNPAIGTLLLSGGCEITVNTPHQHLMAMRNVCKNLDWNNMVDGH
jgi:MtaA/CmuA family methyltransferase